MNRRNFIRSIAGFFTAAFFVKGSKIEAKAKEWDTIYILKNTAGRTFKNQDITIGENITLTHSTIDNCTITLNKNATLNCCYIRTEKVDSFDNITTSTIAIIRNCYIECDGECGEGCNQFAEGYKCWQPVTWTIEPDRITCDMTACDMTA